MKFKDLVYYKTLQIMFRAKQKTLPEGVQKCCTLQQTKYNSRDDSKFVVPKARKGFKQSCLSSLGGSALE